MQRYNYSIDDVANLTLEQIVEFGKCIYSKPSIERLFSEFINGQINNRENKIENNWNKLLGASEKRKKGEI